MKRRCFRKCSMKGIRAYIFIEIEKVDMFRKVLNKQFIERLRAIFIINKTQLQTPTDCFTPWGDHQGDLIQIEFYLFCNCVLFIINIYIYNVVSYIDIYIYI